MQRPRSWFHSSFLAGALLAASGLGFAACSIPAADVLVVPDCVKADGICVPEGDCASSGGTVPGTSNCHSDDGPTECCMGKEPTPTATSCEGQGGICLPGTDCPLGHGYLPLNGGECAAANASCCIPHAVCGDQSFDCCAEDAGHAYHPARCDHGALVCEPNFDKSLLGACNQNFQGGM
jgi:hypothetical protein